MDEGINYALASGYTDLPYLFLLLKLYRSLFKIKTFNASTQPVTFVSVVVACRNEQKNLPLF